MSPLWFTVILCILQPLEFCIILLLVLLLCNLFLKSTIQINVITVSVAGSELPPVVREHPAFNGHGFILISTLLLFNSHASHTFKHLLKGASRLREATFHHCCCFVFHSSLWLLYVCCFRSFISICLS